MKIIVYPHDLSIGGSQINAIDLAAEIRSFGHDTLIYAIPGPLVEYVREKGLRFVPAHPLSVRPGPTRILELARLARREQADIIHAYEWPPCLDAYFGAHLLGRTRLVCTVLSMGLMPLVPSTVPLLMGTKQLRESALADRGGIVEVLEPPIDTVGDHPELEGSEFRRAHGVEDDELLVVIVSRLAIDLKLDSLVRAIDSVSVLANTYPVRLVIVGGGEAEQQLRKRADGVNQAHGRTVIQIPGPTLDPRSAYASADVVLGMGSSALRAMAIGKPLVVQGERGFSKVLELESFPLFDWQGFYGIGDDQGHNDLLVAQLESLLKDAALRAELGSYGRQVVVDRYSLGDAVTRLNGIYKTVMAPSKRLSCIPEALGIGFRAAVNETRLHSPTFKRTRSVDRERRLTAAAGG